MESRMEVKSPFSRLAPLTRRRLLRSTGGLAIAAAAEMLMPANVQRVLAQGQPRQSSMRDIRHVVMLMQENRSFDHYFGTLAGVRGFSDPNAARQTVAGRSYPVFDQFGYLPGARAHASGYLQPFHLVSNPPAENGQDTNDIAHDWGTQHNSWASGAMNQ